MLIARQKPDATNVAGLRTWNSLGRFVKRGEKGIFILAPMVGRRSTKDVATDEASEDATTEGPLKRADLLAVAHYLIGHLSYSQVPALAKRHKIEAKKDSASAHELMAKQVGTYDEAELCKLLLEISLLDSAYQRSTASRDDILIDAAKRYRVDTEKLQKAVAKEFAAKRDQNAIKQKPCNTEG
jgi:hypothetical protein